jgi:DNA excision repair protein ERCC-2
MAPRFDDERLVLELSVADLLDAKMRRNLGFANRGGYERLWLGQAIHSRYQEESLHQDPTYQREVSVSLSLPHRGWEVRIQGRADGLRREEDGTLVVEEIKSIRRGGQLPAQTREIYERQALLYAWMLARNGEERVRAELILIEIGSDYADREPLELDEAVIDQLVRKRLNALLRGFEGERQAAASRRAAAEALVFPYSTPRLGQEKIVEEVGRALEQREHLLLEAPTGIGKTVAAMLPALRYALENEKRIFVLTAKTLQQKMATQVLELLNLDRSYHSLQLRAKSKMCANGEVICHEEFCPYARDYYLKLHQSGLMPQILGDEVTLLPDAIYERAREREVCPFEVSLELAGRSQVVVCDYNYAFDPYVSLTEFAGDAELDDTILLVDEIHNLVDRGRGYYSPELSSASAAGAAEALKRGKASIHQRAAGLCNRLARLIDDTVAIELEDTGGNVRAAEAVLPEDTLWAMRPAFDEAFVDYVEHQRETSTYQADDRFVSLYFQLLRFLNGLVVSEPEAFNHCVERSRGDSRLRILCKDPGRFLGRVLNRTHSTIGFSATLSPAEFYRDLLGFDAQRTSSLTLPSPFPADNRRVVIDDSISTLYREREANYQPIADQLAKLATAVPGNCLALFPSYRFLSEVHERLELRGRRVLVQSRGSSDKERDEILEALRSPLAGDCLLLAVAGGVFAEGVDYPGDMLRAVAVVGPCLPALTLDQELLKRYYDERFERGFEYAFVVPGMTRVVQAAGRLIRSSQDIGIIALLDRRFLYPPYRDHLPGDWLAGAGPEALVSSPSEAAREFFERL